jgi:hypothetical protein
METLRDLFSPGAFTVFQAGHVQAKVPADHATYLQLMNKCVEFLQQPYAPRKTNLYKEILSLAGSKFLTSCLGFYRQPNMLLVARYSIQVT